MLNPVVEPGNLTELDRFIFESWGYLIIPNVLTSEEIQECLEASQRVHANAGTSGFGQVGRGYEVEPALARLIDHPAIVPKIRGLYGDRFILQAGWNTMQPVGGPVGGWHQDGSGVYNFNRLGYPIPLVQLRASFLLNDQEDMRRGNMELIPGSHRSTVPIPASILSDRGEVPISQVIRASAGSVLLFHNAVWHRTCPHEGESDRYTMHCIYSPPWVRPSDRLTNRPAFLESASPLRRGLMGEFERPDAPYGIGYEPLEFNEVI